MQGTNNRSINVIHEGSGDYSGNAAPGREPLHTEGLTDDQIDIIRARLADHSRGTMAMSTQTGHVIVISSDEDMIRVIKGAKPKMVDKETKYDLEEKNIITKLESVESKVTEKLNELAKMIPNQKQTKVSKNRKKTSSDNEHDVDNVHEVNIDNEHDVDNVHEVNNDNENDVDNVHEVNIDNEHDVDNVHEVNNDNEHDVDNVHEVNIDNEHDVDIYMK